MKILIQSPIELPFTRDSRYTGIERLACQFANELHRTGHEVAIIAHKDTLIDEGVKLLSAEGYGNSRIHAEIRAYYRYEFEYDKYDVIHDWGHLHIPARTKPNRKVVSVLNQSPVYGILPVAPYNLI